MAQTPADLNRSWDHAEARHDIAQALGGKTGAPFKEQAEILGEELTGKAIALGFFGAPGTRDDTKYELADPYGGYWGVSTDGYGHSFDTTVWQASKPVHTEHTTEPTDTLELGAAHGLNSANDGPA